MQPCNRLTAKEIQVAMLVWEGQTNREIAKVIGTTEQVIKNYLRNTFDKLGVWSRLELALYVAAHGGNHWRERADLSSAPATLIPEAPHPTPAATRSGSTTIDGNDQRSKQLAYKPKVTPRLISA
jgi:DNA-binding CsgD family transcriptional regulator